jgi:queuine tRNA-ribosyltransferase
MEANCKVAAQTPESSSRFPFECLALDPLTQARRGRLHLPHGIVETPTFMPVGTQATVKGATIQQLRDAEVSILLGNTYHLALRPGSDRIARLGGLHAFMGWDRPILTDSGGFQIFSLSDLAKINEKEAVFRSHLDGSLVRLSPERAVEIQEDLGSDIAMVLDHVVALPGEPSVVADACWRSVRWAERALVAAKRRDQARFAIVQGGLDLDLRRQCADALVQMPFDGFAVGGLSVGEPPAEMYRILDGITQHLPAKRPRYLMGVGRPIDLLEAIARGIDMFDCVMPTRNGRNAFAFTWEGILRLRNQKYAEDRSPLDPDCPCPACRHSRAYLRHLFQSKEMLGPILLTLHNITFYLRLMKEARDAIALGTFQGLLERARAKWSPAEKAE